MSRSQAERVRLAREHLKALRRHVARGELEDELIFDAVCQRLAAAIEGLDQLAPALLRQEFGADWKLIKATRNAIAHSYAFVDAALIRSTIAKDLTTLEAGVERPAVALRGD